MEEGRVHSLANSFALSTLNPLPPSFPPSLEARPLQKHDRRMRICGRADGWPIGVTTAASLPASAPRPSTTNRGASKRGELR